MTADARPGLLLQLLADAETDGLTVSRSEDQPAHHSETSSQKQTRLVLESGRN